MAKDVGLPGIAPEDVKVTPAQQAQIDAYLAQQKAEEEALGKEEQLELMESEIMGCTRILQHLQTKYGQRPARYENLISLKEEADELFGVIGLQVVVDWVLPGLHINQQPPTITVVGRLEGFEFNPEQARYEVGKGVADDYYDMKRKQQKNKGKLIVPGQ
jgi:hypothetical protein